MAAKKLSAKHLRREIPTKSLPFETTAEIKPIQGVIGQERALKALELGLEIQSSGYNIFATGIVGTGRTTIIKKILRDYAQKQPVPDDWCYVYNFDDPDSPKALSLPAGVGRKFQNDMMEFVETLWREIKRAFSGEHYAQQRKNIISQINQKKREIMEELEEKAISLNLKIQPTPAGFQTIPVKDGEPISAERYQELPEAEKEQIKKNIATIEEAISDALRLLTRLDIQARKELINLDEEVTRFIVEQFVDELKNNYKKYPQVLDYLDEVCRDIVVNTSAFLAPTNSDGEESTEYSATELFQRYRINVVVDNGGRKGAPVIHETHPTYNNLIGRIEKYPIPGGGYATDFTMIKAGSLLKANGGYLLMDAEELLRYPFVYDALKRSLRNHKIQIEDANDVYGVIPIVSLKPQAIPLDVKVVLIGWQRIYHLLNAYDDDFLRVFKVRADFEEAAPVKGKVLLNYARFVKRIINEEALPDFHRDAVAEIIHYGHRLSGEKSKISLEFGQIIRIVQQASFWAKKDNADIVLQKHVLQAIEEYEKQHNRIKEQMLENITKDIRKIVVDGERVGEINALSVYHIGDYSFGLPSRITAKTFIGNDAITTIERKVGLSGRIHDKGSFILSGYFNAVFGEYMPVNFSASITFEQSYGRIDGDSASSTELYALLSSLAEVPIKQGIAVTGSVNQNGEIQAIGGVNEKVEGFFEVCRQKGLTGQQGVLIPANNVGELQLKPAVVEAVQSGQFHIWTAQNLEDGVTLLMGMRLGQRNKKGHFPKNTLFYKIEQKLRELNIRSEMYRSQIGDEANHRLGKDGKKKSRKKPLRPAAAPPKAAKNRR